jgi:thiol-disulfide isomerase/thioredoxin
MKPIVLLLFFALASCTKAQKVVFPQEALADVFLSLEGEQIAFSKILESHKGEVVFVDIWASWCRDCIKGMPVLRQLQKEYNAVTFLFLSLDRSEKKWKQGIEKYPLVGEHYFSFKGWNSPFNKAIDLDWIPRYMIIDAEGKIALYDAETLNDPHLLKVLKEITNRN